MKILQSISFYLGVVFMCFGVAYIFISCNALGSEKTETAPDTVYIEKPAEIFEPYKNRLSDCPIGDIHFKAAQEFVGGIENLDSLYLVGVMHYPTFNAIGFRAKSKKDNAWGYGEIKILDPCKPDSLEFNR